MPTCNGVVRADPDDALAAIAASAAIAFDIIFFELFVVSNSL